MKKIQILLLALLMLMYPAGCSTNKSQAEVLAETEFDDMKIIFYYDSSIHNNFGIYYTNDLDHYQHLTYETIKSANQKSVFYIDETGENLIYENEEKIVPVEYVELNTPDVQWKAAIYHLDAEKEYWKIGAGQKDYRILGCVSSATDRSSVCSGGFEIEKDTYLDMLNSWQKVDHVEETLEFELFMSVHNNWIQILNTESMSVDWMLSKSEQEDGGWYVCVENENKTYYYLNETEVIQLKKLMANMEE